VKTAVQRVIVFLLTAGAHFEIPHCRIGPVVRNIFDDREAGAAVGAVGESIVEPAI
jgi:hypothetical protein